ncbi:hypothetical protein Tco_0353201 [Tanacetum coccineum]
MKVCGGGRCDQKGGIKGVWDVEKVVGGCDEVLERKWWWCSLQIHFAHFVHFGRRFICHWTNLEVGQALQQFNGDDSLEGMSIMLVRATFLGGFLVEDEALEAILKVD